MLERIDLAGILHVIVARLLLEVDVKTALREYAPDLKDKLWCLWEEGQPYVEEAAGEALALLDPPETVSRLREIITGYDPTDGQGLTPEERLLQYRIHGERALSRPLAERAVPLLGKVTSHESVEILMELFQFGRGTIPNLAARTLARIENPSLRKRFHALVSAVSPGDPLWQRFLWWVESSGHVDHAALLQKHLATANPDYLCRPFGGSGSDSSRSG